MQIGFDLDGIFIATPPFVPKALIEWLYRKHDHRLFYRIPSKPEQFFRLITHLSPFRPPIVANIKCVKEVSRKNNHKYFIISSRFSFLKKKTDTIIKQYKLHTVFDEMFFNFEDKQPHIFKDKIVKKLKLDYYVDDDLALLKFLAEKNPKTKFFWLSKKDAAVDKNITAIKDLSEMFT